MGALGAGVSLAIASSLMLLVVSAVVAFNGWPDDLDGSDAPRVASLTKAKDAPRTARVTAAVSLPASPATRRAQRRSAAANPAASDQISVAAATDTAGTDVVSAPSADGAPTGSPGPARTEVPAASGAVGQVSDVVADVVAPVAPAVGSALESVGAAGADAAERVDGTVQQLLP